MASSSTSSNQKSFKYHVFLSFRGEDTRKTFVDHLYASLTRLGIHTFRDNEELEKGKQIDQLFKAIEESRYFIIVFSKNYASSSWCLKEVTKIMECQDGNQQIAYPLFYDVEPSDIRYQTGPVGTAISKHKTTKQVKRWKKALEGAGNLVGWDLKNIANGHEAEAIKKVVERVSLKLRSIHLSNDKNLIGMHRRMQDVESYLGIGLNDEVRMIGIKGMGGIGKTTLARTIFDKVSSHFESSLFIEDIREVSKKKGLRSLQKRVVSGVLNDEHMRMDSVYEWERIMRMRLPYKKVLLVLDDVDDAKQLQALAGDWFKDGSRIIITTRDEQVLLAHGVNKNWIHDATLLLDEEAISLFSRYAFKRYIPDKGFEKLSLEVVRYAAGLPLTIKVLGSHLCGEKEHVWRDGLKRLETIPSQRTLEVLEISYNSLEDDHKEMFLDVACFLKGLSKEYVIQMLESCGFCVTYGLRILEQKSLITIVNDELGMHDRIEELGKNIVRRSHPHEPNKHTRLWNEKEVEELFYGDSETSAACIGLQLEPKELSSESIITRLGSLNKLRYLCLIGKPDDCFPSDWKFDQTKQYFPNSLRFLFWTRYPGFSLPQTFRANNIVSLHLSESRIVQLWESGEEKVLKKLRFLHLRDSKLRTLDLGMTPILELLFLNGCHDLTKLNVPVGCLERLVYVSLFGCSWSLSFSLVKQLESLVLLSLHNLFVSVESLEEFPRDSTNNLPMLRIAFYYSEKGPLSTRFVSKGVFLDLDPCTKLESISGYIFGLQHLTDLTFKGCIPEVPNDLDQFKCLKQLTLDSTHIKCLPDSVCMLKHLNSLTLIDCKHLEELPENLGWLENLEELYLSSTGIRCFPDSICMLKHLKSLKLTSCELLTKFPEDIGQLECLEMLVVTKCTSFGGIPNSICKIKCLKYMCLVSCCQVQKLPEDFGNLECLRELHIGSTGISHLPHNHSLINGLCIYGSISLLQSCTFATEIQTSEEFGAFFNIQSFKYHVFLSFRGEDTRKTFVDHLYASLKQRGIHTFRDNEELEKGKQIDQLFKAIEESRLFIIVFSKNYASSSWCLKELTKIMECQDENEQIAFPLFYDVEPSDLRKRSGPVGRAIAKHKTNKQIKKWEKALEDAGNLVGWDMKNIVNGHEAEAIDKIGKEISLKLRSIHLGNDENLIGMDRPLKDVESSLGIGLNDKTRMIGIKGMGGIGKTTLAKTIFDKVYSHFEGSIFVENVREVSKKKGLESLQKRILSGVLNDEHMRVGSVYEGERIMRMRLPYKKVLVVLDNVDDLKQLEALAGDWFKDGSRIIITTRDEKVLLAHGIDKNWIHDVNLLSDEEAMSLFCRHAFRRYIPDEGYENLSSHVVRYAAGLPLTLKVLGSHLCGEKKHVLEISYNSLEDDIKEMFLDVACFLKGAAEDYAIRMLDSCGFHATYGLRILEQKSLITILNDKLGMHDRIEELGENIVRRSHPHEPNKHSRLWISEEIEELFSDDAGIEASTCIGLQLEPKELSPEFIIKRLGNMNKLRYLGVFGNPNDGFPSDWNFDHPKQYFQNSLKFLFWNGYPFQSLPQPFLANNLVGLELPHSRIVQLWESREQKVFKKLRYLNLRFSKLRTLDLGMTPNLERLVLRDCHDLTEILVPTECLKRLVYVNLIGCSWSVSFSLSKQLESLVLLTLHKLIVSVECLMKLPRDSTNNLPMLRFKFHYCEVQPSSTGSNLKAVFLDLQPCTKLESVSGSICGLRHLIDLTFHGSIPEVPNDLDQLKCLERLTLLSTHIRCLPNTVCMLKHLNSLTLIDCQHLQELPENLGLLENLEELRLSSTSISCLPDSICMLINLKTLQLRSCGFLEKLPEDIGQLECLEELNLTECESLRDIPNSICEMKCLRYLRLPFCSRVEKLPEEFGNLKILKELYIEFTGISHLPPSISSLKGMCIFGSRSLLHSYAFSSEIQTSEEFGTFCYVQAVNSTSATTKLRSQSTRNYLKSHLAKHCGHLKFLPIFPNVYKSVGGPQMFVVTLLKLLALTDHKVIESLPRTSRKYLMAFSSTSFNQKSFKYHVFLSFRGEDARKTFIDHLYTSLTRLGIHTFRDNEELEKGKQIDELFKAIEESRFFIIVFSKNYAASSWCLKELTKIMECQDGSEHIAYPLFYDVDPTDIRFQTGAIAKHKTKKQIKKWEKALEGAGNLVGWDLKNIANGHEAEAIKTIVKEISLKLRTIHLSHDENLVGMESRMKNLESSLEKGLNDEVRMIGIKGMGGIGKTTLARAIFHKISSQFEERERSLQRAGGGGGLLSLQKQVIRDVLSDDNVISVQDAISMMKLRMPLKKVVLVLDDVDHKDQLEALAGALDWFKGGSRIIITTRNKQVLKAHRVNTIHDINLLSNEEAISLFNRYAFARYIPFQGYEDLSFKVVKYAAGLPLTLKVLGSFLLDKEKAAWIDTLKRLETIPETETLGKLEISYDGLDDDQKEIFLDVVCCMKGIWKEDAIRILESCGFHAVIGLAVLEERSLITISNDEFGMHDSIEELGRNIVRRSHPRYPHKHSCMWIDKEIEALCSDDEVTEATVTCIHVKWLNPSPKIIMKGLGKLKNLRILQISERDVGWPRGWSRGNWMSHLYHLIRNQSDDDYLPDNGMFDQYNFPNALRFLKWVSYPYPSLPQTFRANNLVGLELPKSRIMQLWESGEREVQLFLDLRGSRLRTLDLGMTPNLEWLSLRGCHDLTEIHAPARCLERLLYLNLSGCSQFDSFSFIQQLESFEPLSLDKLCVAVTPFPRNACDNLPKLSFKCCYSKKDIEKSVSLDLQPRTNLESVCGNFFGLQHLRHLTFHGCIPELPNDLDQLANLEELNLVSTLIKCLPDSICMLKHLKSIKLERCQLLEELPRDLGQLVCLEKLILNSTIIKYLPDSISMLKDLEYLELIYCQWLEELPRDLGRLECLEKLILRKCASLKNIPNNICNMKCLKELNVKSTRINHLPQSISSLEGLRIVGSQALLQSCVFATKIETCEDETFCHIQAVDNIEAGTGLKNQFIKNFCYRWCRAMVVLVVALLVMQVMMQE
ncbi:hypothetical protein LXL04_010640 [Taraxacum kok-saghyz]